MISLGSQPSADVTITVAGHTGTDVTLSGTTLNADNELTFTASNWSTAQTVTVTATEDADAVADADVTLIHTARRRSVGGTAQPHVHSRFGTTQSVEVSGMLRSTPGSRSSM